MLNYSHFTPPPRHSRFAACLPPSSARLPAPAPDLPKPWPGLTTPRCRVFGCDLAKQNPALPHAPQGPLGTTSMRGRGGRRWTVVWGPNRGGGASERRSGPGQKHRQNDARRAPSRRPLPGMAVRWTLLRKTGARRVRPTALVACKAHSPHSMNPPRRPLRTCAWREVTSPLLRGVFCEGWVLISESVAGLFPEPRHRLKPSKQRV